MQRIDKLLPPEMRDRLPVELVCKTGIIPQTSHRVRHVRLFGNPDALAPIQRLDRGDLVLIPLNQVGKLEQQRLAIGPGDIQAPGGFKCLAGGFDGSVHVVLGSVGDIDEGLASGWVDGGECFRVGRDDPLVIAERQLFPAG